jgi:uncharacterized protein YceH (UPF0502 family)
MLGRMVVLTPDELRVLGCLIEKEATTPDQYPLTMNALLLACNQTSNRNPVVSWDSSVVEPVIAHLRELGLARVVHQQGGRADKYRHVVHEAWGLTAGELAVLAVLALRGPQTANELRIRTERYPGMDDMGGVDGILHRLKNRYDDPYVIRLPRQPGQRDDRWAHLLAGEVLTVPEPAAATSRGAGSADRISLLERQFAEMSGELAELRKEIDELRQLLS